MSGVAVSSDPQKVMIGNFKGVMLCNRPFAGISAVTTKQKCKDGSSFICGTVAKPWGSNVAIAEKSRVLTRLSKKDGALSKHKKWLKDLQEEKERIEKDRNNQTRLKEEKKRKFMEREAKKRSTAWGMEDELPDCAGEQELCERKRQAGYKDNDPPQEPENDSLCTKPAWALTESMSNEVNETAEAREEEELLSFVDELDLDKYSHDLELQVLMDQVKGRIRMLQREMNVDQSRLDAAKNSEMAALLAEKLNSGQEIDMDLVTNECRDDYDSDDDVRSIAESVRSEATLGSVHSQKSLEALVASRSKVTRASSESHEQLDPILEGPAGESNINPPVLVTHTEDNGARLAETKSLNKLPFKNRNPAL